MRSFTAVKLGSTWGPFRHFDEVCRNSFSRCSYQHIKMPSWSRSFGFRRPQSLQEVLKEAPKGPQEGALEGGKTGYEIGLELEALLGPILDPFGGSFWGLLGAILRPLWCPLMGLLVPSCLSSTKENGVASKTLITCARRYDQAHLPALFSSSTWRAKLQKACI